MAEHDEWKDDTVRRDPIRPILVAVDFSAVSRHALHWAIEYAVGTGCEIHTIHVIDRRLHRGDLAADPAALKADLSRIHAEAAAELKQLIDDGQRARLGHLHEHVAIGGSADEILACAASIGAGTIVIGSHGRSGVERLLIGSVAERVVRGATCPVVVVKGDPSKP